MKNASMKEQHSIHQCSTCFPGRERPPSALAADDRSPYGPRCASDLALQEAQLSQRDRAAGWVSNGQKWKTGTERQYLRTI